MKNRRAHFRMAGYRFLEVCMKKATCTFSNEKTDVHIFVWRVARHTKMCTSVFSFIPQGNAKQQLSVLII